MVMLQGNTYWLAVRVEDCEGKVVGGDRVAKGRFEVGGIVKYYGEGGEVVWDEQVGAFLFPLSEEETFTLSGGIEYQARVVLEDGTVCGSVPEEYYVYESLSKELISDGGYGTQNGVVLNAKLVNYVQGGGSGGTSDYNALKNKPSINGVELKGDKTTEELGIVSKETDPTVPAHVKAISEQDIQSWDNKAEKREIPDVSQFITNTVDNLVNYYTKVETDNKLSSIPKFDIVPVDELPNENISNTSIYLLKVGSDSPTLYEEYIYVNGAWELLGTAKVDLTGYVKDTDYAGYNKAGVVKINGTYGVVVYNDKGEIGLTTCPNENIINKTGFYAIQPTNIDLAVKVGLTTNNETLTEEEQAKAKAWLGVKDATNIPVFSATQLEDDSYSLTMTTSDVVAETLDEINGEVV